MLFTQRQRIRGKLRDKEDQLHKQELARMEREKEIAALNAMMQGQEEGRKRIAEDLHDRLGAKLSAIKLFHESARTRDERTRKVGQLLDETIHETREIAHNLASGILTQLGLVPALEDFVNTMGATDKMDMQLSTTNLGERLPKELENALYHIVQELVTNTFRHANASAVSIQLIRHSSKALTVVYEDNGKGFDVDTPIPMNGMGLGNVRARLSLFSGKLVIDSAPGSGSTFLIDIPLG